MALFCSVLDYPNVDDFVKIQNRFFVISSETRNLGLPGG